jgi:hypothetical protein
MKPKKMIVQNGAFYLRDLEITREVTPSYTIPLTIHILLSPLICSVCRSEGGMTKDIECAGTLTNLNAEWRRLQTKSQSRRRRARPRTQVHPKRPARHSRGSEMATQRRGTREEMKKRDNGRWSSDEVSAQLHGVSWAAKRSYQATPTVTRNALEASRAIGSAVAGRIAQRAAQATTRNESQRGR